eukprot:1083540-Rhodomonas_salina.4
MLWQHPWQSVHRLCEFRICNLNDWQQHHVRCPRSASHAQGCAPWQPRPGQLRSQQTRGSMLHDASASRMRLASPPASESTTGTTTCGSRALRGTPHSRTSRHSMKADIHTRTRCTDADGYDTLTVPHGYAHLGGRLGGPWWGVSHSHSSASVRVHAVSVSLRPGSGWMTAVRLSLQPECCSVSSLSSAATLSLSASGGVSLAVADAHARTSHCA